MLMATWSVVRPRGMRAGQEITAGIRSPPSSNSVFLPVNGHVSEKRSPPLSLVKMTIVFSGIRTVRVQRHEHAPRSASMSLDHPLIGFRVPPSKIQTGFLPARRSDSASSPGASHGQCGALKWRLTKTARMISRSR